MAYVEIKPLQYQNIHRGVHKSSLMYRSVVEQIGVKFFTLATYLFMFRTNDSILTSI